MVLQKGSFLVVFSLPFSGKDKENRSRTGMGEKPHRAQAMKLTASELSVIQERVPVVNCSGQKLERHPLVAYRQEWDEEEGKTGTKPDIKAQS